MNFCAKYTSVVKSKLTMPTLHDAARRRKSLRGGYKTVHIKTFTIVQSLNEFSSKFLNLNLLSDKVFR